MSDTKSNIKTIFSVLIILFLGLLLRIIFLDKAEGLWNDEYISWQIASIPFGKKFIEAIIAQCHMPFYYLYLKLFIHLFGNSDLMLRLTSVLAGGISITSMYFVGKELKDEKLGLLCATMASLSSFLIYFSQEVRIYGVLFLFSSLSLIFTLRVIKKPNLLNVLLYLISNLLIIFTHTIGFIFVFFNLIFVCSRLKSLFKKQIITIWATLILFLIVLFPHLSRILVSHTYAQWWDHFSFAKIGFLFTDYFSPILTNIVSSPDNFFYNLSACFIIFGMIPSIIMLSALVKAIRTKNKIIIGLLLVCIAHVIVLAIASILGKLVFLTKYSIEIYPVLIAIAGFGILEYKKKTKIILIATFCFLNLLYILIDKNSAPKMHRSEGHKIVAELLNNANLHDGDIIVLNYYPQDRFEKYFNFSKYRVISINKGNFNEYLGDVNSYTTIHDGKNAYRGILSSKNNEHFQSEFNTRIKNKLKKGQKVAIVILKDVAIYPPKTLHKITKDNELYKKAPFLFLIFSDIKNLILKESVTTLDIRRLEEKGSWTVVIFEKH